MYDPGGQRTFIAVVGLGVAGSLAAVHLCEGASSHPRHEPIELLLIDPGSDAGEAPSHQDPHRHPLRTPVESMSCFGGDAEHFARWLCRRGECPSSTDSVPSWYRYRNYLSHTVGESIIQAHGIANVRRLRNRVEWFERVDGCGATLYLDNGEACRVDSVVIATGPACAWEPEEADRWAPRFVDHDATDPAPCCARGESGTGGAEYVPPVYSMPNHHERCSAASTDHVPLLRTEAARVAARVLAGKASWRGIG